MKRSLFALALAAALPFSAQASELSYSYVELDYSRASIDGSDANPDGFAVKGSVKVAEPVYLFGSYLRGSDSVLGIDVDYDQSQIGVGYRHGISDKADFIAELSYLNAGVDIEGFGDANADGYRVSGGMRGLLSDKFEGTFKVNYTDGGDFDGEFSGTLGAQYKFNQTWGLTGEVEVGESTEIYTIGVRASF